MRYMYNNEEYDSIEKLIENEDIFSVMSLEQQRSMLLDVDEEYNEDNYEDTYYCDKCGCACKDVYYTEYIEHIEGDCFCSIECSIDYINRHIESIEEIKIIE